MRIALLGGTGDIGEGLALRWGADTDHELLVGSRDPERARERAADYEETLADRGIAATVLGFANGMAAERGDVVVLGIPPYHVRDTVEAVGERLADDAVLVNPAVGFDRDERGFHYDQPSVGSLTELVARAAPEGVPVVGAFHNTPAGRLADLDAELGIDVLVVGDDAAAKGTVGDLADEIEGLRAVDAGGLANAPEVEAVTPLLCNVAEHDGGHDLGVRFR